MVRKVFFWCHLAAGVTAGVIILIMSATGAALTYERQINEWTTSHLGSMPPSHDAKPLPVEALLAEVSRSHPGLDITGVTLNSRRGAAVTVLAEPAPIFVDAYTGIELGERRGANIRAFLASMRAWHRWLAVEGEQRSLARVVTGWSNLLFLFIVASGMYLWIPRVLKWSQIRLVLLFRRQYGTGKARDFNWHNVIGIWSAIPLFVIVLGAVPISFPWGNDLVYRLVGEQPPARPQGRPTLAQGQRQGGEGARAEGGPRAGGAGDQRGARNDGMRSALVLDGLNTGFSRAMSEQPDWRTISVRFPRRAENPLLLTIDRGDGGQPQLRSTLTLTRGGEVTAREAFGDQTTGRQLRSVLRFAHTGEVLGIVGQTVAGLACAGATLMVWTGLALSLRRLRSWQTRRSPLPIPIDAGAANPAMSVRRPHQSLEV